MPRAYRAPGTRPGSTCATTGVRTVGGTAAAPDDSALLRGLREELGRPMLHRLAAAFRTAQVDRLVLGDMFDMLEELAAFRATILVRGHGRLHRRSRARARSCRRTPAGQEAQY